MSMTLTAAALFFNFVPMSPVCSPSSLKLSLVLLLLLLPLRLALGSESSVFVLSSGSPVLIIWPCPLKPIVY